MSSVCCMLLAVPTVHALGPKPDVGDAERYLDDFTGQTGVEQTSLNERAGLGFEVLFSVVGVLFFILAVYGGVLWLTAQGQEDQIERARNILVQATIGLVVVTGAYAITSLVTRTAVQNISSGDPVNTR